MPGVVIGLKLAQALLASIAFTMRAAGPATRPAVSLLQLRAYPVDMLLSGLRFFDGDHPADPFIARERRNVLPLDARGCVGKEGLA